MIVCRRAAVVAGLSTALALCAGAATAGDAPAPPTPSRAMQRDIDAVNRLLRERQMQPAPPAAATATPSGAPPPPAAAGVPSERAPLGAPERQRPVPATVRPAPAAPRTPPPDAATIAAAIERLARENPMERELAQKQLRAAGAAAVPALINALEDENAPARRAAIAVLGQIRDPRAAEPLAALLGTSSTPTWNVLSGAFRALGGEAAPALVDALGSGDDIARSRAAELMGAIADPRFADPLIERLNRDRHSGVRVKIAEALGRIGERSACEALLVMLDEP